MDVFLFMSEREGLSVAILEAMACGLPIVMTDVAGAAEQVSHGYNGFLVEVGAVGAAAGQIGQIVQDPELQATLGARSRDRAEQNFGVSRMVEGYQSAYREACAASSAG